MPTRSANARWEGGLKGGKGRFSLGSGALEAPYSFGTRFEDEPGTNPEELIAGAHAACFSMALSAGLEREGTPPTSVETTASVLFEKTEPGFRITRITLDCTAEVPGIDDTAFQEAAEAAKTGCPISNALAAVPEIVLNARLK